MSYTFPGTEYEIEPLAKSDGKSYADKLLDPLVIVTLALALIGVLQWNILSKTDETLRLEQRAWLSAARAVLNGPPQQGQRLKGAIAFVNAGKEPATNVNSKIQFNVVKQIDLNSDEYFSPTSKLFPENHSCDGLRPAEGGFSIAPLAEHPSQRPFLTDKNISIDGDIADHTKTLVVQGCFAYLTLTETHRTAVCYFLHQITVDEVPPPSPRHPPDIEPGQWVLLPCNRGFVSD